MLKYFAFCGSFFLLFSCSKKDNQIIQSEPFVSYYENDVKYEFIPDGKSVYMRTFGTEAHALRVYLTGHLSDQSGIAALLIDVKNREHIQVGKEYIQEASTVFIDSTNIIAFTYWRENSYSNRKRIDSHTIELKTTKITFNRILVDNLEGEFFVELFDDSQDPGDQVRMIQGKFNFVAHQSIK